MAMTTVVVPKAIADPVFILTLPRSLSSVIAAMIGQHPQAYGIPESQLMVSETVEHWLEICPKQSYPMAHGLLRTVAQVFFGHQSETTIRRAVEWIEQRSGSTTGEILTEIAASVYPRVLVDKSPALVFHAESLQRTYRIFPRARFIHLLRHPRGYCESVMKGIAEALTQDGVPFWLLHLAVHPPLEPITTGVAVDADFDPQRSWCQLNKNICDFLDVVPDNQKLRVRAEDLLQTPGEGLQQIAAWLNLRTDQNAVKAMEHPEYSPYSHFGPKGARLGNARHFLDDPRLRPSRGRPQALRGQLSWRKDWREFSPEVMKLAHSFGYS